MDVTGVPSADFGHRSATLVAVATLWDLQCGTRRARHCSRSCSADTDHPDSPPTGEGVRRCHVSFREERSSHTVGVPDLPLLSEVRDLHVSPGSSSVHARTPTRGSGAVPRHYCRRNTAGRSAQSSRNQGRNPGRQRRTAPSHSVLPTVSGHCTPRFRGGRRLLCPTHVRCPSL